MIATIADCKISQKLVNEKVQIALLAASSEPVTTSQSIVARRSQKRGSQEVEMRRTTGLIIALMLSTGAQQCLAEDIGGNYAVSGKDAINTPYTGTASITMTGDAMCTITMSTPAGDMTGHCMVTERFVAAHARLTDDLHSMAIYERGADGVLSGTWVLSAKKGTGSETLTPVE